MPETQKAEAVSSPVQDWEELTPADFEPAVWTPPSPSGGSTRGRSRSIWKRLAHHPAARVSLGVLVVLFLFAFLGPVLLPYSYEQTDKTAGNLSFYHYDAQGRLRPFGYSARELERKAAGQRVFPHILGTDVLGRDLLARLMAATRISLLVGICATLIVVVAGSAYGLLAGFLGGTADAVMMRIADVFYGVPDVLVALLLASWLRPMLTDWAAAHPEAAWGSFLARIPSLLSIFLAFGLIYWTGMSRIVRGQVRSISQREYVMAARALGASRARVIWKHLLPNCAGQIVVTACLQVPSAIFLESFLSFLGLGVAAPMTSLGSMAAEAMGSIYSHPYRLLLPIAVLSLIILCFQVLGDRLRDALDPRLKD